jgi:plasmid stabilization system protein ParE
MDYIADRSGFDAAESFLDRINNKCQTLSKFPSMGRNRDELMENVRSFPILAIRWNGSESCVKIVRFQVGMNNAA